MIKWSIGQKDTAILSLHGPDNGAEIHGKQKRVKRKERKIIPKLLLETSLLYKTDRITIQKISKDTKEHSDSIYQGDLVCIFTKSHSITAEGTVFSSDRGKYAKIDRFMDHKTNLNTFLKTETVQSVFCNHNQTRKQ